PVEAGAAQARDGRPSQATAGAGAAAEFEFEPGARSGPESEPGSARRARAERESVWQSVRFGQHGGGRTGSGAARTAEQAGTEWPAGPAWAAESRATARQCARGSAGEPRSEAGARAARARPTRRHGGRVRRSRRARAAADRRAAQAAGRAVERV